ncbi:xanthine dehydrogenase family protein subunit M [soil metagenome]
MRSDVAAMDLLQPRTVEEAVLLLRDNPGTAPLAGGTDLYVALNLGTLQGRSFLDLWALDELRQIRDTDGVLSIGALASYSEIIRSRAVRARLPMLVAASREIGGVQIQNRGTLGGNIANGSPAGDSLPVLLAADAVIVLRSAAGERRVPIVDFYLAYRQSVMRADEIITTVEIPRTDGKQWFHKVGTRAAQAISKVVMAGIRGDRVRLAIGSVAPVPLRLPRTEEALSNGAGIEHARVELDAEIAPMDDLRSTERYRRRVAGNLLDRFWRETTAE